jgi:hypothetical protein
MIVIVPFITIAQIPNNIPKEGLVGWYPFNGNANDESGNENHGIVNGATLSTDRYGNENRAFYFRGFNNGNNDHIKINKSATLSNFESFTIQIYYKAIEDTLMAGYSSGQNQTGTLAAWEGDGIGTPPGFIVDFKADDTIPSVGYFYTGGCCDAHVYHQNHDSLTVKTNYEKWNHLVIVANQESYKIYLNGELQLEKEHISNFSLLDNLDLYIGLYGSVEGEEPFWYPFNGYIDDVAIWKKQLSEEEIKKLYYGNKNTACSLYGTLTNGLVAYYPFCGNANDESGNGLDGTVNGAELTFDRFGNSNSAYSFTTNQDITVPNTEDLNLLPITISLWYNIDTLYTGDDGNIFSKYTSAGWNGYIIHVQDFLNERRLAPWYIRDQSNRVLGLYGEPPFHQADFDNNTWYNFVFTIDENGGEIYVNGELYASDSWTGEAGPSNNSHLWKIGGLYDEWFHGQIDDIGIWNRVLTAQEIKGLFDGNDITQLCSLSGSLKDSLVAFYPFCGNANDESGNGLNGTVNGAGLAFDRYGNPNSAYSFTTNQYITIPNTEDKNLLPLTISLWYNADTVTAGNIFSKYSPGIWNGYQILASDNRIVDNGDTILNNGFGIPSWYIRSRDNKVLGYYTEPPFLQHDISFDTWYHYVFVVDKTGGKIYVNGKLIATDIWTGEAGTCNNNILWKIGGLYDDWYYGKIDDIGIWNRTLTEQEILNLYNGTIDTTLEMNCPENITVSCINEVPLPDTTLVKVTGNCENITIEFISDISDNMSCPETITRTYRATDDCGNIVTCSQLIIVNDLEPPVISCPPNMTFTCGSIIPPAVTTVPEFISEGGYISDNCGVVELNVIEDIPEIDNILGTFTRTYQTVDNCGNVATCSHVIEIIDIIPPTFTTPTDITISKDEDCNYYAGTEITGEVTDGFDECSGNIQTIFNDEIVVEVNGDETITRTWTLTDDYGNFTTGVQTIYIEDVTPPYIFCPSDVSVKNKSEIPEPISSFDEFINDNGEISDNCEIITSSFELFYEFLDTLVVPNELKRTYIISDKAGNESVCLHKIAIENATSLNEINSTNEFQFKVYPNPAKEYVTFDIQNIEILTGYSLKITNILGQEIFQTEINQPIFKLDTRNWGGKGLYFVNIINSYGVTIDTKKIVLQ